MVFELLPVTVCLTGKLAVRGGRNGRFTSLFVPQAYCKRYENNFFDGFVDFCLSCNV